VAPGWFRRGVFVNAVLGSAKSGAADTPWVAAQNRRGQKIEQTRSSARRVFRPTKVFALPSGNHIDDLDSIIFLDVLVAEKITADRFPVAFHQNSFGG
jgi:hypothetical protein